jgi:hypothetical protein
VGPSNFLDIYPDAVEGAGRQTAATASDWAGWAGRSEALLRSAAGGSRSAKVTNAFETYLSLWNPTMRGLGVRANNLGTNAVSGSTTITSADGDSAAILGSQLAAGQSQATHLSRPINGAV